jgi:translation initiation factor eIF-2B subunit epsilon
MRDLDNRGILANDFLVVYGDVVSNLPLEGALAAHRARRAADKNAIMTMVLREAGQTHRTKSQGVKPVFVIDPMKARCLHYEQILPNHSGGRFINLDPDLLKEHAELDIRTDLIDCGIDICTPDALALWSDNFDFQAPRRNFLHQVLKDYELNGKTIHSHIVTDHYAARVRNLHAYASVSKDIISRWAYPLCPDSNLLRGQSYRLQKGNIYLEQGVILARSCTINRGSVIGKGTSIGEGSVITNSIIGRNCILGRNVTVEGAYVWNNASLGDGTVVKDAIIAEEAAIGKKCRIQPGALVSFGVQVADSTIIQGDSRVTRMKRKREDDEYMERGEPDVRIVGEGGDGFEYIDSDDEDDAVEGLAATGLGKSSASMGMTYGANMQIVYNMSALALSTESISTLNSEDDFSDGPIPRDRSAGGSFVSIDSDESGHAVAAARDFHTEATRSINDALDEEQDAANIQLELSALKLAANASEHAVRRAVISGFLKRISSLVEGGTGVKEAPSKLLPKYKLLLERTMFDKDDDAKPDQVDFMLILQHDCVHRKDGEQILLHFSLALSKYDVIEAEGFEAWWNDAKSTENEEMQNVREKTKTLIDYLLQSDGEESEEDEDDEDEEDED